MKRKQLWRFSMSARRRFRTFGVVSMSSVSDCKMCHNIAKRCHRVKCAQWLLLLTSRLRAYILFANAHRHLKHPICSWARWPTAGSKWQAMGPSSSSHSFSRIHRRYQPFIIYLFVVFFFSSSRFSYAPIVIWHCHADCIDLFTHNNANSNGVSREMFSLLGAARRRTWYFSDRVELHEKCVNSMRNFWTIPSPRLFIIVLRTKLVRFSIEYVRVPEWVWVRVF